MTLNYFGIDKYVKLHGFMMYDVMLAVGRISRENYYSFQCSNVGSYDMAECPSYVKLWTIYPTKCYNATHVIL